MEHDDQTLKLAKSILISNDKYFKQYWDCLDLTGLDYLSGWTFTIRPKKDTITFSQVLSFSNRDTTNVEIVNINSYDFHMIYEKDSYGKLLDFTRGLIIKSRSNFVMSKKFINDTADFNNMFGILSPKLSIYRCPTNMIITSYGDNYLLFLLNVEYNSPIDLIKGFINE